MLTNAERKYARLNSGLPDELTYASYNIILGSVVVYGLFAVAFGLTAMKGGDMQPKFAAGDLLLYYRLTDDFADVFFIIYYQYFLFTHHILSLSSLYKRHYSNSGISLAKFTQFKRLNIGH